ncbi:MAG TPA: PilZ domain-containing protein [Candidatus Dormibacteraeota bacterium]|nr:PilZ domain-containing protein [Candidatus Dormibacteraeota bacterium]
MEMPLGMGNPKAFTAPRKEARIPMEVGVQIKGQTTVREAETTFTENVSSRGARVWSSQRWKINDELIISTLPGSFHATARVAYCQPARGTGFAVGLEFVEPRGSWVVEGAFEN